ncbi:MAG: hypothetical protein A2V79_03345 [Betaproteobacteria bacterium RBG_16_56_24]|nr:MAG: hypothetical protein A2V79_03345 [Betaproteobacteria bacterium RBG_16_56_24]
MNRILQLADSLLDQRPALQVGMISLALVAVIAAAAYAVGHEITVSIFFLIPVALATWYGNFRLGAFFCILSVSIWYLIDAGWSAHSSGIHFPPYWNSAIRLGLFLATAQLLTQLKAHLIIERNLSRTDELTGVLNGRGFTELAEKMFELSERHGRSTTLAYIDLDNFKQVNDGFGHSEGDKVLKVIGGIFLQSVRRTDVVGRLGGDEFAIVLPETSEAGARPMLDKLRTELAKAMQEHNWPVGFSIGVVSFNLPPYNLDEAIKVGDALMYRVKQNGKNGTLFEQFPLQRSAAWI